MKDKIAYGLVFLVAFILGGTVMLGINRFVGTKSVGTIGISSSNNSSSCQACAETVIVEEGSLSAAVEKVYNASVMVKNYQNNNKLAGSGSGFVYKIEGEYAYIMTNHHVVDGGKKFEIVTSKDETIEATLLGSDEYLDLAVLKVKKNNTLVTAKIGKTEEIKLGDKVFAIGTPVDYSYRLTVTDGIISGLNRQVSVSISGSTEDWVMEVIQTNTAVNPGNSGGPLVNAKGEVIGIISMKLVDSSIEGMGFAIPIDFAISHIETLEKGQKIERPYLGISMLNVTDSWQLYRQGITINSEVDEGVVIVSVDEKVAAGKAGLKKGDVILKVGNVEVSDVAYLKYALYKYKPGDVVEFTYYRDGSIKTTKVTLGKSA